MKITLQKIVEGVDSLTILQNTKLPIKVSYRLKRLVDKLEGELKTYNEKRNELVKELGEENEKKIVAVKPENLEEFNKKHKELLEVETEIDFTPIKLKELGEMNIEPKHLLDFVFEE